MKNVTIKIFFPQIVLDSKQIEVTQQQADDLILHHIEREKFIWDNMTEHEQQHTFGEKMVHEFLDNLGRFKIIEVVKFCKFCKYNEAQKNSDLCKDCNDL